MGFQHFVGSASAGRIQRGDPALCGPVRAAGTAAERPVTLRKRVQKPTAAPDSFGRSVQNWLRIGKMTIYTGK